MPQDKKFAEKYHITRQHYWYSGDYAVEVSRGRDSCGPDALMPVWEAESWYDSPKEAVEAALHIRDWWLELWNKESTGEECPDIVVTFSNTGLHGFEGEAMTDQELMSWAAREYESLVKCDHCGELVSKNDKYTIDDFDGDFFCSQNCAENAYWELNNQLDEEAEDDQIVDNQRLLLVRE
jgi:hypothetical protein